MDSPPPAHWTFAERAGYFGDQVLSIFPPLCPVCDHHNPFGAKFCNDCGSPLDLKPCNQCDAVNHQTATNCYKCGAECPALFTTPEATPVLPAADPTPASATPGDVGVAATVTQPLFAAGALRTGWRLLRPGQLLAASARHAAERVGVTKPPPVQVITPLLRRRDLLFLLAAIATILIAGAYAAYRINAATPDAIGVASQPVGAGEDNAPTAASAVPMAVESKPVEPETTAALQAPIPTPNTDAPKRANARQRPGPVPATKRAAPKRASARQRLVPERQAPVGETPPVAQTLAAAPVGALVAETREAPRPDPWQAMHESLARCGGDLIDRIVCDQRVRQRFCEGHWGEARECGSGVANDRGQ